MREVICISSIRFHPFSYILTESSQAWLLRRGNSAISAEPVLPVRIRGYLDRDNDEHLLRLGTEVTLGIRAIGGVDYIVGVVRNGLIRPMIDHGGGKLMINMVERSGFVINNDEYDYLFGVAPQHTVQGITAPPLPPPPPEHPPSPEHPAQEHHHHHQ